MLLSMRLLDINSLSSSKSFLFSFRFIFFINISDYNGLKLHRL